MFTLASCLAVVKDSIKECKEAGLFCSSSPSEEIGLLCSSAGARRDSVVAASARSSASLCRGVGDLAVEQDRWGGGRRDPAEEARPVPKRGGWLSRPEERSKITLTCGSHTSAAGDREEGPGDPRRRGGPRTDGAEDRGGGAEERWPAVASGAWGGDEAAGVPGSRRTVELRGAGGGGQVAGGGLRGAVVTADGGEEGRLGESTAGCLRKLACFPQLPYTES
jgi:hypothetical protein